MQSQVQAGTVAGIPQQTPVIPTDNTLYSDTIDMLNPTVASGLSGLNKNQNITVPQTITQQNTAVQQPTPTPVVATTQTSKIKPNIKKTTGVIQQPSEQQDISGSPKRIDTTDTSGKVNVKKTGMQQIAEKKGLVKDGNVVSQEQLNKYALQRASDSIKNIATRGEKVDEARLNDIFDTTLSTIGIQPGTPQYMNAVDNIKKSYLEQVKGSGFSSIEQSLDSLNKKYKEFGQLKNLSSDAIYNSFDNYSPEQKDFIAQNNPVEYQKAKQRYDEQKKTQQMNDMMTGNIKRTTTDDLKQQAKGQMGSIGGTKATQDYDNYINTTELLEAEKMLTVNDEEIAKLQVSLEPQNLKKEIMGRYSTALSSSALDALYYDEANDRQQTLQTLLGQREMALKEYNRIRDENMDRYKVVKQNEDQIVSTLFANGGVGLASSSIADIDQYVKDGYMTDAMASTLKKQINGMMDKTLQSMGKITPQMSGKVQGMLQSGMSPSSILTHLINSGEYQIPIKGDRKTYENSDGTFTRINNDTGEYTVINPGDISAKGMSAISKAQTIPDGSSNYNCATFINACTGQTVGTTIQDKINKIDRNAGPTPGNIMVISGTNNTYGHVALVEGVLPDGKIQIREANYDGKGSVRSTIIDPSNPGGAYGMKGKVKIEGYQQVGTPIQQGDVFADPGSDTISLIKASKGGGAKPTESERSALSTIGEALGQVGSLNQSISSYQKGMFGDKFAPISGIIAKNNPRDDKAKALKAQMQGIIPSIARGVFGEKGVLTDADVNNYMKTLPQINNTANANELIQLVFLGTLRSKMENTLKGQARNGIDVSKWEGGYIDINNQINELQNKLQGGTTTNAIGTGRSRTRY